jgi:hypothetical protein
LNWYAVVSGGSYAGSGTVTGAAHAALFSSYGLMETLPERIISTIRKTIGIFGCRFKKIIGG